MAWFSLIIDIAKDKDTETHQFLPKKEQRIKLI